MASVQLRKCNESLGDVVVSKDINLDIHEGEFVVFVGPSGCGNHPAAYDCCRVRKLRSAGPVYR